MTNSSDTPVENPVRNQYNSDTSNPPYEKSLGSVIANTEASTCSQRVSLATADGGVNTSPSTPTTPPPPPPQHAFSSLPLVPGAGLSSSYSPTNSGSRICEQSQNLGHVPADSSRRQVAEFPVDISKKDIDKKDIDEDDNKRERKTNSSLTVSDEKIIEQCKDDSDNVDVIDSNAARPDLKESSCSEEDSKELENEALLPTHQVKLPDINTKQIASMTPMIMESQDDRKDGNHHPSSPSHYLPSDSTCGVYCASSEASDGANAVPRVQHGKHFYDSDLSNEGLLVSTGKSSKKLEVGLITASGASSPSVLSSQEDNGKAGSVNGKDPEEVKRREENRINHLNLLLEMHCQNEKRKANLDTCEKTWTRSSDSEGYEDKTKKKKRRNTQSLGGKSVEVGYKTDSTRTSTRLTSSHMLSDVIQRNFNPTAIFESFEKNWTPYPSPLSLNTERVCFASAVVILLEDNCASSSSMHSAKECSARNDKSSQKGRNSPSTMEVPLQVVKLFWKKTILPTLGIPIDDADVLIENIVEKLFDKLRYLVLSPVTHATSSLSSHVDTGSMNQKAAVHLSHEVYGEYAKYIMNCDDTMRHQLDEWRSGFVTILENIFTPEAEESVPIDIRRYAAISLPIQIVSLCKSLRTFSLSPMIAKERHREYTEKFVKIMTNSYFLSWRMVVFGDGMKIDGSISVEYIGKRKKVKRKVASSDFVKNHWDILNASSHHVIDLEHFMSTFYSTGTDLEVKTNVTNTFLSMYNAWKMQCLEVLKIAKKRLSLDDNEHVFGRKHDKKAKKLLTSNFNVTNGSNKGDVTPTKSSYADPGSSAIVNSSIDESPNFFNDSRDKSFHVQRNIPMKKYKKSKDLAYVRHIASCTDGLPAQYKALPGEFTIDPKMNLVSLKKVTPVRDPKSGMRPLPRVRVLHNSSRMISKSPVMRLSDILAIDLRVLYLQVTLGKVMTILSQSIAEASGINCKVNRTDLFQVSSSPLLAMAKVNYTSESIEIYSRTMNILSFLLSEDLCHVDEDDLTDLGYHDNGKGSLPARIKKLRYDRKEGNGLLGQLRILCAESWFNIGKIMCDGAKSGRATAVEMAKISITSLPIDTSYSDNGQQCQDRKVGCDEPEKLQNKVLHCYQFSLSLLRQNSKAGHNSETSSFSSRSRSCDDTVDNTSIGFHKRTLLASIVHSIGVHYYAQVGNLETAKLCLHEALSRRRLLLRQLQKESNDVTSVSVSSLNDSSQQSRQQSRRRSIEHGNGPDNIRYNRKIRKTSSNLKEGSGQTNLLFSYGLGKTEQIEKMELELSYTLEFAALTSHSHLDHQTSISFFQEAIILRALHVGKNSPDVARLHYNMGVIHDDLGQHEASLSRYGKSLKVRLSQLDRFNTRNDHSKPNKALKTTAFSDINDLEATVVLTLRCMGNVYRALKDSTNALCCYMKAIELLKTKLKRIATTSSFGIYQGSSDFELGFGKGLGSKPVDLPIPDSNLDEMQVKHDDYVPLAPILGLLGDGSMSEPSLFDIKPSLSESDNIRKDIANMYSTVVSLVNDRKQEDDPSTVGSGRSGYLSAGGYSSGGYGSGYGSVCSGHSSVRKVVKPKKASGKDHLDGNASDDVILLDAAFNLGMLTMHFGEYQNAMCYFEEAFRTIWISMGCGDASDSDISSKMSSMASSKEKVKSSKSSKSSVKSGEVEEGIVYHAMAVAHAALSEHERAVRCYLTALRYYRRRLGMDSVKVAGALYDCGSSYWHLGDYIKAEEFWADCFRIIFREGKNILEKTNKLSIATDSSLSELPSKDDNVKKSKESNAKVDDAEYARILHNLGNVHLQNGHLGIASQCYEEALAIRRKLLNVSANDHTVLTQLCESNVSRGIHHEKLRDMANTLHNLGWLYEMQCMYEKSLTCLNQALFIKQNLSKHIETHCQRSDEKNSAAIVLRDDETNLGKTLSCAITLLRIGSVHVKIYNHDIGLSYYRAALSIQKNELGQDHIAVARTLFDMGQIANHHTDASGLNKDAMKCFNEALRIAKLQFGQHHCAVAGVMYDIGSIHDKSGNDFDAISYYRNSVSVYGRIYAKSLLKRFCFVPIFRNVISGKSTSYEGFNPAGLGDQYSMENRARSSVQQAAAIEDGKDKELFIRASIALTTVAERSGAINQYTLLGFELSFWKFVEGLAASGMESIRARVRRFLLAFVNHFEQSNESEHMVTRRQQTISDSFFQNVWN